MKRKGTFPRPHIILHMVVSLDSKVTGEFLSTEDGQRACDRYYKIHRELEAQGFICGRITMEDSFTKGKAPELEKYAGQAIDRTDYVAKKAPFYAVSIDPKGVVGWYGADIVDDDEGYNGAHIIEVLSSRASDEYIAYLRDKGVSYIFCGEDKIDIPTLCEKLYTLFGIERILLEGGGKTNSTFLEAGVIDEINLVVCPEATDGSEIDLFDGVRATRALRKYKLTKTELGDDDILTMLYVKKRGFKC